MVRRSSGILHIVSFASILYSQIDLKLKYTLEDDKLVNTIGGGKPKMKYYFNHDAKSWPITTKPFKPEPHTDEERNNLVDMLQNKKTEIYKGIIEELATSRPGVLELMDEAIANPGLKVAIIFKQR